MKTWPRSTSSRICRKKKVSSSVRICEPSTIGVGHDDDLVVAQLVRIELVRADPGAKRGDQRADLLARQHLVEACALDIQDLAAQRQYGLVLAGAALLGRATGGVTLDEEQLGFGRIASWQSASLPAGWRYRAPLAPRQLARLAGGLAGCCGGFGTLETTMRASAGCSSSQVDSAWLTMFSTTGRTSDETSLSLVCDENFGSGTFTETTAVSPSRQSSPVASPSPSW